jgi:hypothetical protein
MMTTREQLREQVLKAELPWHEPDIEQGLLVWKGPTSQLVGSPSGLFEHKSDDPRFLPCPNDPDDEASPLSEYTRWINQWYLDTFRRSVEALGLPWHEPLYYNTDGGDFEWLCSEGRLGAGIEITGEFFSYLIKGRQGEPASIESFENDTPENHYREYVSWLSPNSTS